MISNDTMNALADMVAKEPDLAKQVAAIKNQDEARALLMRMAAERGIAWREEPQRHTLSDEDLREVSGGWSQADMDAERQQQAMRIAECQKVLFMIPGICTAGQTAVNNLGWNA